MNLNDLATKVHKTAEEKGWWDGVEPEAIIPEKIALMHSELSEALEEYRDGQPYIYHQNDGKPEGLAVELADCIIRILDLAEALGINMQEVIRRKMVYNETRPYRHGGKKI